MKMKVLICGCDGYIGFPLSLHLLERGHEVVGIDCFLRRAMVKEMGSYSIIPIKSMNERLEVIKRLGKKIQFYRGTLLDYDFISGVLKKEKPDSIVNLAQQPSPAYSMIDAQHANMTIRNNVEGIVNLLWTMKKYTPKSHMTTLGTMGEYGQPNMPIPEGFAEMTYKDMMDYLPFPRQAGSFYHWSKVDASHKAFYTCQIWGLKVTDIMQGVVYGTQTEETVLTEEFNTRFDIDECFGTMMNRACACAIIGHPIIPYGKGGQTRGYIALRDSIQCLTLSVENPPMEDDSVNGYRVMNQFDECYSCNEIADKVSETASKMGFNITVKHIENPRVEKEEHFYQPEHVKLYRLGFKPTHTLEQELKIMLEDLTKYEKRILKMKHKIIPKIKWR